MKKVVIAGAGKTGESVLKHLINEGGFKIYVFDDSREALSRLNKEVKGGWMPVENAESILAIKPDIFIPSPGINPRHPAVKNSLAAGAAIMSDIEIFERKFKGTIIGVTGTNGKTTVATLIAQMFEAGGAETFLGGNVGNPCLNALEKNYDVAVLELSSFQLHYSRNFSAHTGVLVSIDIDHLDWHESVEEYHRDKVEWLFRVREKRVFNADDPFINKYLKEEDEKDFPVSLKRAFKQGAWLEGEKLIIKNEVVGGGVMFFPSSLPEFYAMDVSLACAVSFVNGISPAVIEKVATNFRPGRARLQVVSRVGVSHVFDDSKATNPHAVKHALLSMKGKVILMLGGVNKGLSFHPIRELINEKCEAVIFFGKDGKSIMEELKPDVPHICVPTLREAVREAVKIARERGVDILFSPGCASFDEFSGYLERSEKFRKYVLEEAVEKGR